MDHKVKIKESEKIEKYIDLARRVLKTHGDLLPLKLLWKTTN